MKYTKEEIIAAMRKKTPVVFRRWANESELHFERISKLSFCVSEDGRESMELEVCNGRRNSVAVVGVDQITILGGEGR